MLAAFGLLLLCQLAGEIIVRYLALPLPGPVLGLVLLASGLLVAQAVGRIRPETVDDLPSARQRPRFCPFLGCSSCPLASVRLIRSGCSVSMALRCCSR